MQSKFVMSLITIVLGVVLSSCSAGGGSDSPGRPIGPESVLRSCDNVVTAEKVKAFNASHSDFQVTSAGSNVRCTATETIAGNSQSVEVTGFSGISILPNLKFLSVTAVANQRSFLVKTSLTEFTDNDVKSILSRMNISFSDQDLMSFVVDSFDTPSYARFEKGDLFYLSEFQRLLVGGNKEVHFILSTDTLESQDLLQKNISNFFANKINLNILWYPREQQFSWIQLSKIDTVWQTIDTTYVIVSSVKDTKMTNKFAVIKNAISNIEFWNVPVVNIHSQLPELYDYAMDEWVNPTFADNTTSVKISSLRYIIKVNPASPKKIILETYEKINYYFPRISEAAEATVEYLAGKTYSKAQFDLLVEVSKVLSSVTGTKTWKIALSITTHTQYDTASSLFAARVGKLMSENRLASFSDSDASPIFAKIQSGITAATIDLYFSTLDHFRETLSASSVDAETATDSLVLTGKLTTQNKHLYFSFMQWLKNEYYVGFTENLNITNSLSVTSPLSAQKIGLFQATSNWLKDTVYLSRQEALAKAASFGSHGNYSESALSQIQKYFSWLVGSIYLDRTDSLNRAENAVIKQALPATQIENIKNLADWYINTIYLNRTAALDRSENLVLIKKLSPAQTIIMKDLVSWLVDKIYINKSEAADKGEVYVSGAKPLDAQLAEQLKKLTQWYIDFIYMNRNEALTRSENLLITLGTDRAGIDVVQASAEWLISAVYMNRPAAVTKAESYLTVKKLTAALFVQLKSEFDGFINQHKSRNEALRLAEEKVLK